MNTLYGEISDQSFEAYVQKLHKKLFWLLLYKDPNISESFGYVDFNKYFCSLMKELCGLSQILMNPEQLVDLLCILQAAKSEVQAVPFDYKQYRKFVLDAHSQLDKFKPKEQS